MKSFYCNNNNDKINNFSQSVNIIVINLYVLSSIPFNGIPHNTYQCVCSVIRWYYISYFVRGNLQRSQEPDHDTG